MIWMENFMVRELGAVDCWECLNRLNFEIGNEALVQTPRQKERRTLLILDRSGRSCIFYKVACQSMPNS